MVFIVSDQRIATENFEKGKIYKVVFLDESIFYGVCIGIGSNFVMLSGNISGYLFPLTMETASQVESIDLYTPVEPEPPVPPMTNLLQYQTGVPPFDFTTSGTNLWSYYIKGNTVQNGTPTPSSPVDVVGVGELETSGEHSGQYKIPISMGGTTNNVYLGEVQTTRKIKKLVLDGTETGWTKSGTYQGSFFAQVLTNINIAANTEPVQYALCSHAQLVKLANFASGTATLTGNTTTKSINLWIGQPEWTVDEFKAYLAQQYAAGTPVTVWYVLATPQTAVVNEPLMKIGTYADSLTSEQAGSQIPTIVGDNTLSVDTTVQPSEMQIVYEIELE